MTGMFLDFEDDVAGCVFESISINSFCMLLCMFVLPSKPSSAEEEFQQVKQRLQRTLLVVV